MNHIIANTNSCSSCGVCAVSCPQKAIIIDCDGFYRPTVNEDKCSDCGICRKVCYKYLDKKTPFDNAFNNKSIYAAWSKTKKSVITSSSGGVGYELTLYYYHAGYHICGAIFNALGNKCEHIIAGSINDIEAIKTSKYLQSYTVDAFSQFKQGEKYLVVGTPCQIYGLRQWIQIKKWEDQFILVDFFCHGTPSVHLWEKYREFICKEFQLDSKWEYVNFRQKATGSNWHDNSMQIRDVNGKEYEENKAFANDFFYKFFLNNSCLNEACYNCKLRLDHCVSDIRMGDFWGPKYAANNEGVSLVITNTQKGENIWKELEDKFVVEKCGYEDLQLSQPTRYLPANPKRSVVLNLLKGDQALDKIFRTVCAAKETILSKDRKKRIGILTFHYADNYGAVLQCYALLTVLKQSGYEPEIINYRHPPQRGVKTGNEPVFLDFQEKFLRPMSFPVRTDEDLSIAGTNYETVIAGSDQIWRYRYVEEYIKHYFLDFVPDGVKKISYAASFGMDGFEGGRTVIEQIKTLLTRFDAVSVRENSGVEICRSKFGFDAVRVLDPTMLLLPEHYELISGNETDSAKSPYIAYYILDINEHKKRIVEECALKTETEKIISLYIPDFMPEIPGVAYEYPPVPQWLSGIRDTEFVVTDSFHGVVFSILFNKQFLCIGNKERGLARMYDLLTLFGLKERLVTETDFVFPESRIDYSSVNRILTHQRELSLMYLLKAINGQQYESENRVRSVEGSRAKHYRMKDLLKRKYGHIILKYRDSNVVYPVSFIEEKSPVWVFWWQCEINMPDTVRICYESICRNSGTHPVKLVTRQNYTEYVSLPDYIIEKLNSGHISLAQFADILKVNLLYEYGGYWMNATVLVTKTWHKEKNVEFFTIKTISNSTDVSGGRWSGFLTGGGRHGLFFDFAKTLINEYWKNESAMTDDFLMDYITALAYDHLPYFKKMIDGNDCYMPGVFDLSCLLNQPFDPGKFDEICRNAHFHKLSRKSRYVTKNDNGEQTFYEYLKQKNQEQKNFEMEQVISYYSTGNKDDLNKAENLLNKIFHDFENGAYTGDSIYSFGCGIIHLLRKNFVEGNEDDVLSEIDEMAYNDVYYHGKDKEGYPDILMNYLKLRTSGNTDTMDQDMLLKNKQLLCMMLDAVDKEKKVAFNINEQ